MNKTIIQILLGLVFATFIITYFFAGNTKFDELAQGAETVTYQAVDSNEDLIHIIKSNKDVVDSFLKGYKNRGQKEIIYFLGNSQTHSINQKKENQVNFIKLLFDSLAIKKSEVLCNSLPNAGLQEFYLSYLFWKDKIRIKTLVIPVFFDDLREDGIRDVFFEEIINSHFQISDSSNQVSRKINADLKKYWPAIKVTESDNAPKEPSENLALRETVQEGVENKLNLILENHIPAWNNRSNVRGDFFVWLYKMRNTVLGIRANTIRKMIPQRFAYNMAIFDLLVKDCLKNNINIIVYIPPIRSDVPIPYELSKYNSFKSDIANTCKTKPNQITYLDLDKIVPGKLWGVKESTNLLDEVELDYMHFQFKGHQIMADTLLNHILKYN
jgi:hypothetical protein